MSVLWGVVSFWLALTWSPFAWAGWSWREFWTCRVVSRGSLGSKASDFGALEVFGQASIGHTDPYAVIAALDAQMQGVQGYSKPWHEAWQLKCSSNQAHSACQSERSQESSTSRARRICLPVGSWQRNCLLATKLPVVAALLLGEQAITR